MGAAFVIPALIAGALTPVGIAISEAIKDDARNKIDKDESGASDPDLVYCRHHEKCTRSDIPGAHTTFTVVTGINLDDPSDPGGLIVAMYTSTDATSEILDGHRSILRPQTPLGPEFVQTFSPDDTPHRIHITNAGDEPLCVAGISVQYPDHSFLTLSGNLAKLCGYDHYESTVSVLPNDDTPSCVWVDRHGSDDIRLKGLTFDLFGDSHQNVTNLEALCQSPLAVAANDASRPPAVPARSFGSQLIKSNLTSASAQRLCADQSSKGPDFVSLTEQLYCDMDSKHLYPVCSSTTDGKCFDLAQDRLVEVLADSRPDAAPVTTGEGSATDRSVVRRASENDEAAAADAPRKAIHMVKTFDRVSHWEASTRGFAVGMLP